jgi:hypothetical protein
MRAIACILTALTLGVSNAQVLQPVAQLDTNIIRIGEQALVDLSVAYRVDEGERSIVFPEIGDTLTHTIEVLSASEVDSVLQKPDIDPYLFEKRQRIMVTSWDSGYWAIPPFSFVINGDTLETEAMLFEVRTVPVDTAQDFHDIAEIEQLPFSTAHWLKQHWPWIAGSAGLLLAIVAFLFWLKRPKKEGQPQPEPAAPLHVRILSDLEDIQSRKLWQNGHVKQYYSEVTDVLRSYVEERFNVPALERTTYELGRELKLSTMSRDHQQLLINSLQLADMVKFAKVKPGSGENDSILHNAFKLVQETSPELINPTLSNGA